MLVEPVLSEEKSILIERRGKLFDPVYVELARRAWEEKETKGGEGSGNFGHAGRPGEVGGSAAGESENAASIKFESRNDERFSSYDEHRIKSALSKAMDSVGSNAPQIKRVILDPDLIARGQLGTKSKDAIYLNPKLTDEGFREELQKQWDGMIIGNNSLESVVTHEYGHVLANAALNSNPEQFNRTVWDFVNETITHKEPWASESQTGPRYQVDTMNGKSFYCQEHPGEWIAEAFSDVVHNGSHAGAGSQELVARLKRLL
jgi:hypothetical protein